jgi:hypothetical protein
MVQLRSIGAIQSKQSKSKYLKSWINRRTVKVLMTDAEIKDRMKPSRLREIRQQTILHLTQDNPESNNRSLAQQAGCSLSTLRRALRELRISGKIESKVTRKPTTGTRRVIKVNADPERLSLLSKWAKSFLDGIVGVYVSDFVEEDLAKRVAYTWWERLPPTVHWIRPGEDYGDWTQRVLSAGFMPHYTTVLKYQKKQKKRMGVS